MAVEGPMMHAANSMSEAVFFMVCIPCDRHSGPDNLLTTIQPRHCEKIVWGAAVRRTEWGASQVANGQALANRTARMAWAMLRNGQPDLAAA
jgi:hypothetical protein